VGVGLNIKPEALPPPDSLNFPATCLETELPSPRHVVPAFDQAILLQQILKAMLYWRTLAATNVFLQSWERRLAFRGEQVEIRADGQGVRKGQVIGLEQDGSLRLLSPQGQVFTVQFGEVHLRPVV
jgi:BirA family biotin operon repressor/biotin-[acetyl-CoA-carboxylase] ligase